MRWPSMVPPRFTGDLDIWVKPDNSNAERVVAALDEFGFGTVGLTKNDFSSPGKVIQLGMPPVRIDLVTSLTGVTWKEGNAGKVSGTYANVPIYYLGRNEFIKNKKILARQKDLADLEALDAL